MNINKRQLGGALHIIGIYTYIHDTSHRRMVRDDKSLLHPLSIIVESELPPSWQDNYNTLNMK
jgi:hypothetical protein